MMKDIMIKSQYSEQVDKYEMTKMMKEFFGKDHSSDKYEMMEKFFKNKNGMDEFEMMKMMMKFSGEEKNMDMFEMMKMMEKLYGNKENKFDMTNEEYANKFDMMKMMNQQNHDDKNYNMDQGQYAPPQARFRFRRQASGSTKPADYTKPNQGLDKGDRLYAKLEQQKKDMEAYVGNMTCVLRKTNVRLKETLARSILLRLNSSQNAARKESKGCAWTKIPRTRLSPTLDPSKPSWEKPSLQNTNSSLLCNKCSKERNQNIWVSCRSLAIGIILNRHCLFNV